MPRSQTEKTPPNSLQSHVLPDLGLNPYRERSQKTWTSQESAGKPIEAYHPLGTLSSDCSHRVPEPASRTGKDRFGAGPRSGLRQFRALGLQGRPQMTSTASPPYSTGISI